MATPKSKAPAKPAIDEKVTHLVVKSASEGFRRAGRAWSIEPTVVSVDELTEEEIGALLSEPKLTVLPAVGDPTEVTK